MKTAEAGSNKWCCSLYCNPGAVQPLGVPQASAIAAPHAGDVSSPATLGLLVVPLRLWLEAFSDPCGRLLPGLGDAFTGVFAPAFSPRLVGALRACSFDCWAC